MSLPLSTELRLLQRMSSTFTNTAAACSATRFTFSETLFSSTQEPSDIPITAQHPPTTTLSLGSIRHLASSVQHRLPHHTAGYSWFQPQRAAHQFSSRYGDIMSTARFYSSTPEPTIGYAVAPKASEGVGGSSEPSQPGKPAGSRVQVSYSRDGLSIDVPGLGWTDDTKQGGVGVVLMNVVLALAVSNLFYTGNWLLGALFILPAWAMTLARMRTLLAAVYMSESLTIDKRSDTLSLVKTMQMPNQAPNKFLDATCKLSRVLPCSMVVKSGAGVNRLFGLAGDAMLGVQITDGTTILTLGEYLSPPEQRWLASEINTIIDELRFASLLQQHLQKQKAQEAAEQAENQGAKE